MLCSRARTHYSFLHYTISKLLIRAHFEFYFLPLHTSKTTKNHVSAPYSYYSPSTFFTLIPLQKPILTDYTTPNPTSSTILALYKTPIKFSPQITPPSQPTLCMVSPTPTTILTDVASPKRTLMNMNMMSSTSLILRPTMSISQRKADRRPLFLGPPNLLPCRSKWSLTCPNLPRGLQWLETIKRRC